MRATIRATTVDDTVEEFSVWGYGNPMEVIRDAEVTHGEGLWYINSAGYAQKLDEKNPPFLNNSLQGYRLLLIPR